MLKDRNVRCDEDEENIVEKEAEQNEGNDTHVAQPIDGCDGDADSCTENILKDPRPIRMAVQVPGENECE